MNNVIHLGAHAEFNLVTHVLNNQEYRVLYHNEYVAGMLYTFQERELVYLDENMAEMLFHDAAGQFPDILNYMTVDNNNVPYEGIDEARAFCQETLFQLQLELSTHGLRAEPLTCRHHHSQIVTRLPVRHVF